MKWNGNTVVNFNTTDNSALTIPVTLSQSQLFTEVLDIFGKPGRRF
jgi:hypothetical protein